MKPGSTTRWSILFGGVFIEADFEEIIVPSIWEAETFDQKVGAENSQMMWRFQDKGERNVCLIPEVTGLIQETWREEWSKRMKARNVFYAQRCYRYERPQKGRYREFTQFGIEMLGSADSDRAKELLKLCLDKLGVNYVWSESVKRGLSYYVEDGFEAAVESLGAQKQVAGGGTYAEGVGWAFGVDRLMLALEK
jgi:histidyl-tRNA synthetase